MCCGIESGNCKTTAHLNSYHLKHAHMNVLHCRFAVWKWSVTLWCAAVCGHSMSAGVYVTCTHMHHCVNALYPLQARGSSSGAIWRLTVVIAVREHVKATVAVVLDASGPDRLMQRVLKAASSYRQLLSVSRHPGPVLITLATDVRGSHSTTIGSCPTSRLVTPRDASSE